MAVVFISPKQRQKMFFIGITAVFLLFLAILSSGVFMSKPKEVSSALVFNKPKVSIDMSIFDSEQFISLQPFVEMETQYSYSATTKNRRTQTGFISAVSLEEAKTKLESSGLSVAEVKEVEAGRVDPFTPYYQITAAKTVTR